MHNTAVCGLPVSIERSGLMDPYRMAQNVTLEQMIEYYIYYLENLVFTVFDQCSYVRFN